MARRRTAAVLVALAADLLATAALGPANAFAQTPPALDESSSPISVRYSLKSSTLLAQLPDAPELFPDAQTATGFWRFRFEPTVTLSDTAAVDVAVEQRLRLFSSAESAGGILPAEAAGPYRVTQLDWSVASSDHAEWRAEIDRAALRLALPRANVTIGRQAIGWGRAVVFGAIDLFAPFAPLEADREWRRGVDAVRADVKLSSRASVDAVAAFGDTWDRSAVAARVRGYAGRVDVEAVVGRRAGEPVLGGSSSAAIGDVELHAEAARFGAGVMKAVAGGSYRVPVGHGVLVYGEYHYSGYGATSPDQMLLLLQDPAFQARYLRGDVQILGRHALAAMATYEQSPEWTYAAQWLQSPVDGSGVLSPMLTYTPGDRWSVIVNAYVPYGRAPVGTTLGSEFGASPVGVFAQLRIYR